LFSAVLATGCSVEAVPERAATQMRAVGPDAVPSTTSPPPVTVQDRSVAGGLTLAQESFIAECTEHVMTMAFIGDEKNLDLWNWFGQSPEEISGYCADLSEDRYAMSSMRTEMTRTRLFFEAAEAAKAQAEATSTMPRPAATVPRFARAPQVGIECGPPVTGDWSWYRIEYGYRISADAAIVEWGMDYGDGKRFVARDQATALRDVFWHRYTSPGSYRAVAWVVDELGQRSDASCTFTWNWPVQTWTPAPPSGGWDNGGDLDCDDIGEEVWVGDDDPHGLDGDGDGWGCEGW
jgi:hypothetical protein